MADALGAIFNTIGTTGKDIFTGQFGEVLPALGRGAESVVGDIGTSVGDLFKGDIPGFLGLDAGGGGPLSPGTVGAGNVLTPDVGTPAIDIAGTGAAPVGGGTSAAAFGMSPGDVAGGLPAPVTSAVDIASGGGPSAIAGNFAPTGPLETLGAVSGLGGSGAGPLATGGSSFLKKLLGNPVQDASLAALGLALSRAGSQPPELKQLQALANQEQFFGKSQEAIAESEQRGLLPGPFQALVQQMLDANNARTTQAYAAGDIPNSTAEAQDINANTEAAMAEQAQIADQLSHTGFTNMTSGFTGAQSILQAILDQERQQGTELGDALALFAGGLAR